MLSYDFFFWNLNWIERKYCFTIDIVILYITQQSIPISQVFGYFTYEKLLNTLC